jgi:CRP/FNR family transcriptional regulator, cyclic AMP receptor protein
MKPSFDPSILKRFDALSELTGGDLLSMAEALQYTRFRAGAQLCREGDEGDGCYFLASGEVAVTKNLPDGRRVHLATLPERTLFGQSGLVPGQRRTADVKAEGNVEVLTLTRRQLEWGLRQKQPWAVVVQTVVAVALVRQLRSALDRLAALAADENPEEAAEGKTRASIPKPMSVDFRRSKKPAAVEQEIADIIEDAEKAPPAAPQDLEPLELPSEDELLGASDDWQALPPVPEMNEDEALNTQGLLTLLAETESSIAGMGLDLENSVSFVMDEDQKRTAEARLRG